MNCLFTGLWQHPDFMKLWVGQSISQLGSRISREGIPLIAVLVLAATPEQIGSLTALSAIPVLVISLFAGLWIDRLPRRPVMIVADVGRALLLLSIPLAAFTGHLSMYLLLIVSALMGVLGLFFELAYQAALPWLVAREHVLEGNSKLTTTESMAEIAGPALAGLLIQTISAPLAITVDALSFVFSIGTLTAIRRPEPPPIPTQDRKLWWLEISEGLRVVIDHPVLRTLAIGSGARSFFGAFFATLYAIYGLRVLHLTPAIMGILISAGGVGALVGALLSEQISRRMSLGRAMTGALLLAAIVGMMTPLASLAPSTFVAAAMLFVPQLISDGAMVFYAINEISLRQTIVPDHLLGRTGATIGLISQGVAPVGALVAGVLAMRIGTAQTLFIAVTGILITALLMQRSPLRSL